MRALSSWRSGLLISIACTQELGGVARAESAFDEQQDKRVVREGGYPYNPDLPPLIIIPPFIGSVLRADIEEAKIENKLCGLATRQIWPVGKAQGASHLMGCWTEEMGVDIDVEASLAQNREVSIEKPGIHVSTPAPFWESIIPGTYEAVVWQLQLLGYREDRNLFTVPYDWRRGPSYWKYKSWVALKESIEQRVERAGGRPAIFLTCSMGGPYFVGFLLQDSIDAAWKKKHVAGLIANSGPYLGSYSALSYLYWGTGHPGERGDKMKELVVKDTVGAQELFHEEFVENIPSLLNGFGALAFLLPRPSSAEGGADRLLIDFGDSWGQNLTVGMLQNVLDHKSAELATLYNLSLQYETEAHPGVPVWCTYGTHNEAPNYFRYGEARGTDVFRVSAEQEVRAASDLGLDHLKKRAQLDLGDNQSEEQISKFLGDLAAHFAPLVMKSTTTTTQPSTPIDQPPSNVEVGSKPWFEAAARFMEARVPDKTPKVEGDDIVGLASLSVCDTWRGQPGLPDVTVKRLAGVKHGTEMHHKGNLLYMRGVVAKLAGVPDPPVKRARGRGASMMPEGGRGASMMPEDEIISEDCMAKHGLCSEPIGLSECNELARSGLDFNASCCELFSQLVACQNQTCATEYTAMYMFFEHALGGNLVETALSKWSDSCPGAAVPLVNVTRALARQSFWHYREWKREEMQLERERKRNQKTGKTSENLQGGNSHQSAEDVKHTMESVEAAEGGMALASPPLLKLGRAILSRLNAPRHSTSSASLPSRPPQDESMDSFARHGPPASSSRSVGEAGSHPGKSPIRDGEEYGDQRVPGRRVTTTLVAAGAGILAGVVGSAVAVLLVMCARRRRQARIVAGLEAQTRELLDWHSGGGGRDEGEERQQYFRAPPLLL